MARLVAVACIPVAVILSVAWALHTAQPNVVGSNDIRPAIFAGVIPPNGTACDGIGSASSVVNGVQITVATDGKGPQPVRLELPGSRPSPALRSYADGVVTLPLRRALDHVSGAACVHNLGASPLHVGGEKTAAGQGAAVNGQPADFHVSFTLTTAHPPTWWRDASSVLSRVGLARAGAGSPATGVIVLVLLAASLVGAAAAAWRWAS